MGLSKPSYILSPSGRCMRYIQKLRIFFKVIYNQQEYLFFTQNIYYNYSRTDKRSLTFDITGPIKMTACHK